MAQLPDELTALLNTAEGKLDAALAKDVIVKTDADALAAAQKTYADDSAGALALHQDANAAASDALAALRAHFGI
jgi:hypothetical protein